jgi:hypothetical protein
VLFDPNPAAQQENSMKLPIIACALALGMVSTASASTITCESIKGKRQQCKIAGDGSVSLQKQLSKTRCVEDETWGRNMQGIWVDKGCRGQFKFTPSGSSAPSADSGTSFGAGQVVVVTGASSDALDAVALTDGPGRGGVVGRVGNDRLMTVDNCDGDYCHVRTTTGESTAGWISKRNLRAR